MNNVSTKRAGATRGSRASTIITGVLLRQGLIDRIDAVGKASGMNIDQIVNTCLSRGLPVIEASYGKKD
jgi:hypothetical protein